MLTTQRTTGSSQKEKNLQVVTQETKQANCSHNDYLDIVKCLIDKKGANLEIVKYLTGKNDHLDIVKYLTDKKGADVDLQDNRGITPLHWAASLNNSDLVTDFGSKQANRSRRNVREEMEKNLELYKKMEMANMTGVTSGASRATFWIPQLVTGIVRGVYGFFSAKPAVSATMGHRRAQASDQETINQFSTEAHVQGNVSVILLLVQNFFDRICPLPKFQDVAFEEALGYSLSITYEFVEWMRDEYGIQIGESVNLVDMQSEIHEAVVIGNGSKVPSILRLYATPVVGTEKAEVITSQVIESVASAVNQTTKTAKTHLYDVTIENCLRDHGKGSCMK